MKEIIEFKKSFKVEIKAIDLENKTVTAVISNKKKDREGDILPPAAFKKNLKNYKAHPVVLADHNYKTNSVIGQTKSIQIGDDDVQAKMEYFAGLTDKAGNSLNPTADWTWELAKKGLAAYSVGFKGMDFDWIKEKNADGNGDQITGRKFNEVELLEITHCAIPMHQDALQTMINDEETDVELKGVCELVLKGLKSGEITGPKIGTGIEGDDDGMDLPTPKGMTADEIVKHLQTLKGDVLIKFKADLETMLKAPGDDQANMQQQFALMDKRIAAIEVTVSQCESLGLQLKGMLDDIQEDIDSIQAAQEGATPGANTEINEDLGTAASAGKGFKHYSDALFGKAGSAKTKQQQQESATPVLNRLKCLVRKP